MANNNFYARIQQKIDTEENWNKAVNFVPLKGEIIIYDIDSAHDYKRIKIGDGVTTVINLEFVADINDLGAITIDIEGATEGTAIGVNADTFGGYTIDSFVMYNTEGDINFKIPSMTKVTLLSSNWNNNTQIVEVTGIVADETAQMITVIPYNTVDNIAACSGIICTEQGINSLTFTATDEIPNVDVEFIVSWQEVNWI